MISNCHTNLFSGERNTEKIIDYLANSIVENKIKCSGSFFIFCLKITLLETLENSATSVKQSTFAESEKVTSQNLKSNLLHLLLNSKK